MKQLAIHKDNNPTETISNIRNILLRLGLSLKEPINVWNSLNSCWACNIKDFQYPLLSANGKGVTREYALASAYAEYIERLQCYVHERFGLPVDPKKDIHPDSVYIDKHKLAERHPELFLGLSLEDIPQKKLYCLPFALPFEGKVEPLPYLLMLSGTRSTGMSSGNSREEAICQGICEVMERHAFREIALQKVSSFPTVPLDSISIQDHFTADMIKELKEKDIEIIVKDCTFNGSFPVVGVVLIDKKNDSCCVDLGSDPVFEIAFQRCITETYQMRKTLIKSFVTLKNKVQPGKDLFNNPYRIIKYLLGGPEVEASKFIKNFAPPGKSNKYYLKYLLNILVRLNKTIYIRDFSFLNFPSFYVFIPELSSFPPTQDNIDLMFKDLNLILSFLSQIGDTVDKTMIKQLANILLRHFRSKNPFSVEMPGIFEKVLSKSPVFVWVDPAVFLAFVFIETKNFRAAIEFICEDEERNERVGDFLSDFIKLKQIIKRYCELIVQKKNKREILRQLKNEFQNSDYNESLEHLINGYYSSFYNKEGKNCHPKKFDGLLIPRCDGFSLNCNICSCRPYCYLAKYLEVKSKIQKLYLKCNQEELLCYIQKVLNSNLEMPLVETRG